MSLLALQRWAFLTQRVNAAYVQDGVLVLVTPDRVRRALDGTSDVRVAAAFDPSTPSPHPARLGLPSLGREVFLKEPLRDGERVALFDVRPASLTEGASPRVYDALEGRLVIVF